MTTPSYSLKRLIRYGIVGLGSNLSLYLLFLLLVWAGAALCLCLGVVLRFRRNRKLYANRRWTFASRASHVRDLPRFLLAYGVGLLVTLVTMGLLVKMLGPALAQVIAIGITALSIFACLQLLHFGGTAG